MFCVLACFFSDVGAGGVRGVISSHAGGGGDEFGRWLLLRYLFFLGEGKLLLVRPLFLFLGGVR